MWRRLDRRCPGRDRAWYASPAAKARGAITTRSDRNDTQETNRRCPGKDRAWYASPAAKAQGTITTRSDRNDTQGTNRRSPGKDRAWYDTPAAQARDAITTRSDRNVKQDTTHQTKTQPKRTKNSTRTEDSTRTRAVHGLTDTFGYSPKGCIAGYLYRTIACSCPKTAILLQYVCAILLERLYPWILYPYRKYPCGARTRTKNGTRIKTNTRQMHGKLHLRGWVQCPPSEMCTCTRRGEVYTLC